MFESVLQFIKETNVYILSIIFSTVIGIILLVIKKRTQNKIASHNLSLEKQAEEYYAKKSNKQELKLNFQEKLELSWEFLYDIANTVINKFSKEDREAVENIGQKMIELGVKYEHVIDLGIDKRKATKTMSKEMQEKKMNKTRNI